jgi:hypothetical protein
MRPEERLVEPGVGELVGDEALRLEVLAPQNLYGCFMVPVEYTRVLPTIDVEPRVPPPVPVTSMSYVVGSFTVVEPPSRPVPITQKSANAGLIRKVDFERGAPLGIW